MKKEEIAFVKDYAVKHNFDCVEGLLCKYCLELEKRIKILEEG